MPPTVMTKVETWRRKAAELENFITEFTRKHGRKPSYEDIKRANKAGQLKGFSNDTSIMNAYTDLRNLHAEEV